MSHQQLILQPGKKVCYQNRVYRIVRFTSLDLVELIAEDNHEVVIASIMALQTVQADEIKNSSRQDFTEIDKRQWEIAKSRLEIIKPLLDKKSRTREQVEAHAVNNSVSTNTVYNWLRAYEKSGVLSSLLRVARQDKGKHRFSDEIEELISETLATDFLTHQKKSISDFYKILERRCVNAGVICPHENTIRNRIKKISPEKFIRTREGKKKADEMFSSYKGAFPGADWPLSVVQIDHTKLDIILVDDHYRKPIGRPWITLAFDVYSRMVTGFYVSFDPPSALSTGLCLAHSILPKDKWLAKLGINGEWPVWGLPATIHLDNAKEFRGKMLQQACDEYQINIEWRPVGRPHFGAHVERVLGSFAREIHTLPGTTFSNTSAKGTYHSEKNAAFTLTEFELWLSIYITDVYHKKIHSALKMPPIEAYKKGVLGDEKSPGCGLPSKIVDEEKFRLDFMPFYRRTVQDYGIEIDKIYYYHDVLRRWTHAVDPNDRKRKRKFTCRYDPRDISVIWFYDPEVNTYYQIPYRDTSHPAISIWELREAKNKIGADKVDRLSERDIFEAYERMRDIEFVAVEKSKVARRANQRRKHHNNIERPLLDTGTVSNEQKIITDTMPGSPSGIEPYDEMVDLS